MIQAEAKCAPRTTGFTRYFAAIVALVAVALFLATPADAAPSTWTLTTSPNADTTGTLISNSLNGVSCVNSTFCVAVGDAGSPGGASAATLVEVWNGNNWSIVPSSNIQGASSDTLNAVSCTSTTFCMAVGYVENDPRTGSPETLSETWDGSHWSVALGPVIPDAPGRLDGVSCISSTDCVAVGTQVNTSLGGENDTLIESWDGSAWSVAADPGPGTLQGISCTSASFCMAVGSAVTTTVGQDPTLTDTWNGSTWTASPGPNTNGNLGGLLYGVSCTDATDCVAVGGVAVAPGPSEPSGNYVDSLAAGWNGSTWTVSPSPSVGSIDYLTSVWCDQPNDCVAGGWAWYSQGAGPDVNVIESWDGSLWTAASAPSQTNDVNRLAGLSCFDSGDCEAVGSYQIPCDTQCTSGPSYTTIVTGTSGPPPNLPEVPAAVLLPVSTLGLLLGAAVLIRRRQHAQIK